MKFSTKAIHAGQHPDKETGAVMPPIYMSSTYKQDHPTINKGYDYTRANNPNFSFLEEQLASLENAKYATVFSSGLGALTSYISTLQKGDKIVALEGIYGGTWRMLHKVFLKLGVETILLSGNDLNQLKNALSLKPAFLLFETPTNPLLTIHDIESLSSLAKKHGVITLVDNTFATPYFQNPLDLGADIVWHSSTKYLGGHSDLLGGAMITNDEQIKKDLDFARFSIGTNPSPFDTWLISRSIKTLALRMEKHAENAMKFAQFLKSHQYVKNVYYPGLTDHIGYKIAKKQMRGFSGMVSCEFKLSNEKTQRMISSYQLFTLAESLGGVESLVCHPQTMTHASIPKEKREEIGITGGLVRFSVGLEDIDDLIDDVDAYFKSKWRLFI